MQDIQATMRRPSLSSALNPYPPSNTFSHPYRSHFQATSPSTVPSTAPQSTFSPARRGGKSTSATLMSPRISVPDGFQLPDPALSPSTFTPHGLGELYQFVYDGNGGGQGSSSGSNSQQGGAGQANQ